MDLPTGQLLPLSLKQRSFVQCCTTNIPGMTLYSRTTYCLASKHKAGQVVIQIIRKQSAVQVKLTRFGYCVEWRWSWSFNLFCQIQTRPIVSRNHQVFQLCMEGSLRDLQLYLKDSNMSPLVVDKWGCGLLDYCCMVRDCSSPASHTITDVVQNRSSEEAALDLTRFLITQGLNPSSRNTRFGTLVLTHSI
jgi:hypothetical protein